MRKDLKKSERLAAALRRRNPRFADCCGPFGDLCELRYADPFAHAADRRVAGGHPPSRDR
jgi:hypothetical protein